MQRVKVIYVDFECDVLWESCSRTSCKGSLGAGRFSLDPGV